MKGYWNPVKGFHSTKEVSKALSNLRHVIVMTLFPFH